MPRSFNINQLENSKTNSPTTKHERRANTRRWRAHRALEGHQSARTNSTRKHSHPHRQSQGSTMLTLPSALGPHCIFAPVSLGL